LAFYSQDLKLRVLLAPALGPDFQLTVEPDGAKVKEMMSQGHCDVVILDLDSNDGSLESQVGFFEEIAESQSR
jgi:hypothetical protein